MKTLSEIFLSTYQQASACRRKNNSFASFGCVSACVVCECTVLRFSILAAEKPNPFDFSTFNPHRFGDFDPFHPNHLKRCGEARSGKSTG